MSSPEETSPPPLPARSTDAFFGGRFHLVQPRGAGHRSGADALLVAAAVAPTATGRAADLGAGAGAVGLALAARCSGLAVTLVESSPTMAAFARASRDLPQNAGLAGRLSVLEADVTARRPGREAAGLMDGSFEAVVTNPPFHPSGQRKSEDALRASARTLPDEGFLGRWIAAAAALLKSGGILAMIARPENLPVILAAAEGRLGDLRIVPVHSHADRPAIRLLLRARKASRAPISFLPALVLHRPDGGFTPLADAIFRGEEGIAFGPAEDNR